MPFLIVLFACFSLLNPARAAAGSLPVDIPESSDSFAVKEKLKYSLEWLGIPIGTITLESQGTQKFEGRDCYHIVGSARPNRFFTRFYDIEYTVHTYIEKTSFLPLRFEKFRRFNQDTSLVAIDFDRKKNEALYRSQGCAKGLNLSSLRQALNQQNPETIKILTDTQDLFSCLYSFRHSQVKEGSRYAFHIYYNQRNWQVNADAQKPFLKEIRKKGAFAAFGVLLDSDLNDYVLGKRRMEVIFSADRRRIPLEFKFATSIGFIRGAIKEILE